MSKPNKATAEEVWSKEQQYHGGQEWALIDNYVVDFSVTTNCFGTPQHAINEACETLRRDCLHYPAADFEPALSKMAAWLAVEDDASIKPRLQLGNGLSELIDIITRMAPEGAWRPGPYFPLGDDQPSVQYKEYERAATANKRKILGNTEADRKERAALLAVVNPSNPTGGYMDIDALKKWIEETANDNSFVLVDESMLPWHSREWRLQSLLSQTTWIESLFESRKIAVFILHSWTKIWSCPGLRVGSSIAPTPALNEELRALQVPWSLNTAAIRFLELVVDDSEFMERTWAHTSEWRQREVDTIARLFPHWRCFGESWLSWIWIETGSPAEADRVVSVSRDAGVPVRHGKFGYNAPAFVRIAVREPEHQAALFKAWEPLAAEFKQ